jgi:hypothetical protein
MFEKMFNRFRTYVHYMKIAKFHILQKIWSTNELLHSFVVYSSYQYVHMDVKNSLILIQMTYSDLKLTKKPSCRKCWKNFLSLVGFQVWIIWCTFSNFHSVQYVPCVNKFDSSQIVQLLCTLCILCYRELLYIHSWAVFICVAAFDCTQPKKMKWTNYPRNVQCAKMIHRQKLGPI